MIHLGLHADNWRPLSTGFETACQIIAATGLKHIEFCAIHGQNFIAALGYDPGVSLQSNPRAIRRFLDRNGAGKTTTVKMLAGLIWPDAGEIRVNGVESAKFTPAHRWKIGYVSERQILPPPASGSMR